MMGLVEIISMGVISTFNCGCCGYLQYHREFLESINKKCENLTLDSSIFLNLQLNSTMTLEPNYLNSLKQKRK